MSAAPSTPMLLSPHSLVGPPNPASPPSGIEQAPANPTAVRAIVACLDGSELGSGIVPHARIVASALGARLTLLRVLETEPSGSAPANPLDWGIRQREARAQLDDLVRQLAAESEPGVASELIQGRAAEQICSWAEQHDIDLTILCSHGTSGVTDWDLSSTARKLVERIPGSLLLVPASAAMGEPVRYRRILVPLDGSARAESVVPLAMRIAASQQAEVLLVHVVPRPEITRTGPLDAEGAELQRRVLEHNRRVGNVYLDRLRARVCQMGSRVRALVVGDGDVRRKLEGLIREEGVDLVVMSAHGHTGRTGIPCGSVTEYAVAHTSAPVLVVRERPRRRMRRIEASSARTLDRHAAGGHALL